MKTRNKNEGETIRPEFIRLPRNGTRCPWSGLSRTALNSLILPSESNGHKPPVKSISLRPRIGTKGIRLIVYDSLMSYLRSRIERYDEDEK